MLSLRTNLPHSPLTAARRGHSRRRLGLILAATGAYSCANDAQPPQSPASLAVPGDSAKSHGTPVASAPNVNPRRPLAPPRASAKNPIISHLFTADPAAAVYNDRVFVFTSHDLDDQDGYKMIDYHAFSSDDLVNWQDHGVVLDAKSTGWARFLYAPDSCAANGKYYLYYPNEGAAIGVAVSERPEGPYVDVLGKPLIDAQVPGVADVEWIFDPTCFIDDDGQVYLYFGGGPSGTNARVIRLNSDMISLKDASATTISAPDFFEAAYMHKYAGKYYFSYSTGFGSHPAYIDYMVSDNPMTGFEYKGTILASPYENNSNNNHHSIIEYGDQWYMFYHNRVLANRNGKSSFQRSITLDLLTYDQQGHVNEVSTRMGDVPQRKSVDALQRVEAELIAAESGVETGAVVSDGQNVGVMLTELQSGDWVGVSQLDFGNGTTTFRAHAASGNGATIEVRDGCEGFRDPGTLVGVCPVPSTGGQQTWVDVSCPMTMPAGVHDLCLRFTGGEGELLNLDYYWFE